jgi:hypothetical protein
MNALVMLRKILFPTREEMIRLFRRYPTPKGIVGDVIWWGLAAACVALSLAIIGLRS